MKREICVLYILVCVVNINGQGPAENGDLTEPPIEPEPEVPIGVEGPVGPPSSFQCGCGVGFSGYMSNSSATSQSLAMTNGKTLVFDRTTANTGQYSTNDGRFKAPSTGIYAFTWTICVDSRFHEGGYGEYGTQLIVDGLTRGYLHADTETKYEDSCSTAFVICRVFANKYVYLRNVYANQGRLLSIDGQTRTTFSGWKLFN